MTIMSFAAFGYPAKRTLAAIFASFSTTSFPSRGSSSMSSHSSFRQPLVVVSSPMTYGHGVRTRLLSSTATGSSSSNSSNSSNNSFTAPEPPQSSGIAVFPDIDLADGAANVANAILRNSDPSAVFVVNGASRGIGLQFVKHLMTTTQGKIIACSRSPKTATGLQEYLSSLDDTQQQSRIELVSLDLEDQASIEAAASTIRSKVDRVDLLLNVAGILGDSTTTPGPERSVSKIEREWMEKTFQVNVIGPVMFTKELTPLLCQQRRKQKDSCQQRPPAVIANLSARVGSISDNGLGGWYSYRMSKSALNQATRTLANELKRQSVWCLALHPGTTDTDLSKPFQKNVQSGRLFPVEFTVDQLKQVVDAMGEEHSGGLFDWAGKAIPF